MISRYQKEALGKIKACLARVGEQLDRADRQSGYVPDKEISRLTDKLRAQVWDLPPQWRLEHSDLMRQLEACTNLKLQWGGILDRVDALLRQDSGASTDQGQPRPKDPAAPQLKACAGGQDHLWVACFLQSGPLAFWQCDTCGVADREVGRLPEPLESVNCWIKAPARLVAPGPTPPVSHQRWATNHGTTLVQGEPCSTNHVGLAIPDLPRAHSYEELDAQGELSQRHEAGRKRHAPHGDHYTLTRYQVVDDELVLFSSHCFEESTYDSPSTSTPRRKIILSGLLPL